MNTVALTPLAVREVFHMEFLRRLGEKLDPKSFALKGGVNMRLFFGSVRYSEDLDLDVAGIPLERLKETVLSILRSRTFLDTARSYGLRDVVLPDLLKAKQTETTQRFKIHILTSAGEDLPARIEISRRGLRGGTVVELVPDAAIRAYRAAPFWISHYGLAAAITQKTEALAGRTAVQARDIFDLHILFSRLGGGEAFPTIPSAATRKARERLFEVEFESFRDTVLSYLDPADRTGYDRPEAWDELRLKVAGYLEKAGERHG